MLHLAAVISSNFSGKYDTDFPPWKRDNVKAFTRLYQESESKIK